jgi:hypothetical protein
VKAAGLPLVGVRVLDHTDVLAMTDAEIDALVGTSVVELPDVPETTRSAP